MAHRDILEPFDRMLAELFAPAAVRAMEKSDNWQNAWDAIAASGFLDALVLEDQGGFGLDWNVAAALFQLLGRHAAPLPIGETMVLRAHLKGQGIECPNGPLVDKTGDRSLGAYLVKGANALPVDANAESVSAQLALVYAAQIAGAAARLLDMTVAYANERVQFGKPIGRQQAVQQQLAVMAQEAVAVRLAVELACTDAEPPSALKAASAKAIASRFAASIAATAHGVHGAIGISAEYDLQLLTRRLHVWRLAGGSETYWDRTIGEAVIAGDETALDWVRHTLHC